ncbi:hypothetical protein A0H81_04218 [Grifola frondosa]|uniref:Trs120/TRAPPC9 N-terminal domain-containing protein n=1 Tax=Grifola frondosa TaxID=5627 RepID=A0A1C7MGH2_GRIFR|nr:hypothetical protein A0H81_04218 [Grifola frondosa]
MEPFAFASLAHVQILLLPVGNIRRATFDKWASDIRSFDSIRLGDIPAIPEMREPASCPILLLQDTFILAILRIHLPHRMRRLLCFVRPISL